MYSVIDENNDFLIVNKFPGIGFHNENGKTGLFSLIKEDFKINKLFPVHRLDKITSGIIIIAKNENTASVISKQFSGKEIEKYYIALSDKKPKKKRGIITGEIVKSRRSSWKLTRNTGNPSITKFVSEKLDDKLYFFLIKPLTGKTHQIRVVLKSMGSPVIGDPIYYKKSLPEYNRAYLHSYFIKFTINNEIYKYICPPNCGKLFSVKSFSAFLDKYKEPAGFFR